MSTISTEQAIEMLKTATEQLFQQGAIVIQVSKRWGSPDNDLDWWLHIEVQLYNKAEYEKIPVEPNIEYISQTNRYRTSKEYGGVTFFRLLEAEEVLGLPPALLALSSATEQQ